MTAHRQIVIIDDEGERLDGLTNAVRSALPDVPVIKWRPTSDQDYVTHFLQLLAEPTGLVVTDHDLSKGVPNLRGSSITAYSQERFIPVCNFSRKRVRNRGRESNFFELRIPHTPNDAPIVRYIERIYRGFEALNNKIANLPGATPPAPALLASVIGEPDLEQELTPYITSVGSASSTFLQNLLEDDELPSTPDNQVAFQAFHLGHVLVNAVLAFPGPIMTLECLAAYCAMDASSGPAITELFREAIYTGPFSQGDSYFVRSKVESRVDELAASQDAPAGQDDLEVDQYTHSVVSQAIGQNYPHSCDRCSGERGGLWCPFTRRAVCNREDCSVPSATWIPRGATLCRVERSHFERWAPLLGE